MKAIISTIEELKSTVKVNAVTQFSVVAPYIQQARDIILVRYLGLELVEILEGDTVPDRAKELLKLTQCALGPLSIWVGNAELSVRLSDNGFTVAMKAGEYGAASDTKIAKVEESLERRGFQYLDQVLEYLEANAADFPEWTNSHSFTLRAGNYIKSATQFQEIGLVDIDYSRLTFESFRPIMSMIEMRFITELLGETLDSTLRSKLNIVQSVAEKELIGSIRRFVACKTAEIHTSQASKSNRLGSRLQSSEYKPVIRPLYSDIQNEGNYFAEQGDYFYTKIKQTLNKYAVEFGIEVTSETMDFNSAESKIFNSFG
jgi:hypothetical protein